MLVQKIPIFSDRQQRLLVLLNSLGGQIGKLDFQKLLFLYCQEPWNSKDYEFVPYKYGAFSFTSYSDRRKLIEQGLLENDEHSWSLTNKGQKLIQVTRSGDLHLSAFVQKYQRLRGDALVAETYRSHPYYATRSEIAERVLRGDTIALQRIKEATTTPQTAMLATIGYEGRTLERYLNDLLTKGITLLCDVRRNPISRKYGFSKSTLSKSCGDVGIRYEHIPELGIASDQRQNLDTQAEYDALFKKYERYSLPKQTSAVSRIYDFIQQGERVALTCYELLPHQCHRHCIVKVLESTPGFNSDVLNL
jgi:hypothetical protein